MKIVILVILFSTVLAGCNTLDTYIPANTQCTLIKIGVKTGIKLDIGKLEVKEKNKEAIKKVITKVILPKLQNKDVVVTRADIDEALELLDKELTENQKLAVQNSIELILAWSPKFPEIKSSTIGSSLLRNVICLFKGVLEATINQDLSIMTRKRKALKWE